MGRDNPRRKAAVVFSIIGLHTRRLGVIRVLVGGIGIYLSIPVFILLHGLVIKVLLQGILCPLLDLNLRSTKNFIIVDRYKVEGLPLIDKIHCMFCGWANGICTFLNYAVDHVSENPKKRALPQKIVVSLLCISYVPPALLLQLAFYFIYNHLIASPMCLVKVYYSPIIDHHRSSVNYAENYGVWATRFLNYQKISWTALNLALRQIESTWCPIRHFEKMQGVVYPAHHKLFFEPNEVEQLRQFLQNHATVLVREAGSTDHSLR